jgi:hypothetical protein
MIAIIKLTPIKAKPSPNSNNPRALTKDVKNKTNNTIKNIIPIHIISPISNF